jgi:SAM-dependent methyltransferase
VKDISSYNRTAWDGLVSRGNPWTVPVTAAQVNAARQGNWQVVLTPLKPVPREWFGQIDGARVLCLAGAGGQQGPLLAAAGADVTVLDNSPAQLARDEKVSLDHGLGIRTELGLMQDLSRFPDASFDLVFHPVSNCFVQDIQPVWREAFRVLARGGRLLAGFCNPVLFGFDPDASGVPALQWKYRLPYSDLESRSPDDLKRHIDSGEPLEFSHSLEDQIGGQLRAGFLLSQLYEDTAPDMELAEYFPPFIATLAVKPASTI